ILRGYKDTRSIFFITFTAYWVLGLPSGYILALTDLVVDRMGPLSAGAAFRVLAPATAQRTAFEKYYGTDTGAIVGRIALNIEDH
ncbi:MATE family efflux transporter, partial [Salmonella enterica subsp. enterica serovar Montevideo]|nr:MATE family efflux transporter [Salmonella enterica subsp. enterica serovar Montevideo]